MQLIDSEKIGEFLAIGVEMDNELEEIGLMLASADVSSACAFKYDEWEAFVDLVNKAHEKYKEEIE